MDIINNFNQVSQLSLPERCEQMIQDLESEYGVSLTFRDHFGLLSTASGDPLLKVDRFSHAHPYCNAFRRKGGAYDRRCLDHCLHELSRRSQTSSRPFIHHCWKDALELVVPVYRGQQNVLTIIAGAFRDKDHGPNCQDPADSTRLAKVYEQLKPYDAVSCERLGRLLQTLGLGLLMEVEANYDMHDEQPDRQQLIMRFIHYHAHEDIRLKDLAALLHLSPSRSRHLVRELFDSSFQDLLIKERVRRARVLLITTRRDLASVARSCGYSNAYYFNRQFKQAYGMPPGRYRKQHAI